MTNGSILKIIIKPVGIGIYRILWWCPVGLILIRFDTRKFSGIRILHKPFHLFYECVRNLVFLAIIIIAFVYIMSKLQRVHHFGHIDRWTEADCSIVRDTCFILSTAFGSNNNHTIGSTGTINSGCRSIFQYTDRFNIVRIHILKALLNSVDQHIRFSFINRTRTTNIELDFSTHFTADTISNCICWKIQACDITLKGTGQVRYRTTGDCFRTYRSNGSRNSAALLLVHTYNYYLIEHLSIFS